MNDKIKRYQFYNRSRKERAIQFNARSSTLFFKVIPFLLHCNYPDLPGFIDDPDCKYGIYHFQPDRFLDSSLFRRYFPESTALSIKTPSPYASAPYIHSLKTIGSIGTIAQTAKSDCDYWVSVRYADLGEKGEELLTRKCRLISAWAKKKGFEAHFFLMDIEQTRENRFTSHAEEESAGSALKLLLKDELFRTHILVAGKMLLWWLIPPGLSHDAYLQHVRKLVADGLNMENYIDLGYLSGIPRAEIFGACLWQLNKALDSPFKSVIKFAYLELLLNKADTLPFFSSKIVRMVTFPELLPEGEPHLELTAIDPYLLLARDLVAFYQQTSAVYKDDNLIRECLFLKTLEGMKSQQKGPQLQRTMDLMSSWNLLPPHMEDFLHISTWGYNELLAAGVEVHNYLLSTYKRLRLLIAAAEQQGVEHTITQRDISVLGRKLFTFYENKPHKIEYIRSLSRDIMCQKAITFHITRSEGKISFYAFQGEQSSDSIRQNRELQIRRETNIITLIAWLVVNGILQKSTEIHLADNLLQIHLPDIQALADQLILQFPLINFSKITATELLKKERIIQALAVINFLKLPIRGEKELHSSIITVNNYGEHTIHHYTTLTQLKNAFRQLLTSHYVSRWNHNLEVFIPTQPEKYYIEEMIKK
ncbi:MAG: class I adenylate cyclase [Desulfurivibrionaceae bacterium]|nr:class I adenylate cyclase [Desulfurivibrionaceae bacterium]